MAPQTVAQYPVQAFAAHGLETDRPKGRRGLEEDGVLVEAEAEVLRDEWFKVRGAREAAARWGW